MTKFVINLCFWGYTIIFRPPFEKKNEKKIRQGGLIFDKIVSIFWLFWVTMTT
jgi:hypothetical protein